MTNEERRAALNRAREKALAYAEAASSGTFSQTYTPREELALLSQTWSLVAQAMKDGDPAHDAPDGAQYLTDYGVETR